MNFQEKVKQFQLLGGEDLNSGLTPLRESLLKEEIQELETAIANNDRVEILDALCDIKYVNDGNANYLKEEQFDEAYYKHYSVIPFGFNSFEDAILVYLDLSMYAVNEVDDYNHSVITLAKCLGFTLENFKTALDRVHDSNCSKFCNTEQEAFDTMQSYLELDEPVRTYSKQNGDKWVVYRLADNKILKSKYYNRVILDDLV